MQPIESYVDRQLEADPGDQTRASGELKYKFDDDYLGLTPGKVLTIQTTSTSREKSTSQALEGILKTCA